ncbi:spore coat protein I [Thalassobacillus devorans]|uniref:Spore coat protein I n=1 Tax=Thalassobacillus devorans TaxID=279813 RepID=A0ABQ1P0A2_9BACI|nr:CotS family spore coat protein [Thalassobacillus devorans]NIK28143.1 CotS family spore coat protein [Thalassobacillus devorans]GGC88547.1 spore coat protein I [Thalassobacillus devorans]
MKGHNIEPWAEEAMEDSLYVPPYVEEMAREVLKHYDFQSIDNMTVMATKPVKGGAIWKIETERGPFSLKLLHRRIPKSKFSLGAQEYLVNEKNANVPAIIKTQTEENYVEMGGKLWFVAIWIQTLRQLPEGLEGTKKLCEALGDFHKLTKGYVPPEDAEFVSRLHRWPRTYERLEKKLNWFRDIAHAYDEMPASSTILSVIDMYQTQAREARHRLSESSYASILERGTEEASLVHQDYGWSNAQIADDGMWVIDLDGVSFDIAIRDLRKLIIDRMAAIGKWDADYIREMIQSYNAVNPISDEEYEMLLIDLSLPNSFYKEIKPIVYSPTTFMTDEFNQQLQFINELEKTKWPVLQELAEDRKGGLSFK